MRISTNISIKFKGSIEERTFCLESWQKYHRSGYPETDHRRVHMNICEEYYVRKVRERPSGQME